MEIIIEKQEKNSNLHRLIPIYLYTLPVTTQNILDKWVHTQACLTPLGIGKYGELFPASFFISTIVSIAA